METINENCYVYKWTHIPTLKWYVGVRFAKGCYPDDGYICSSKIVKPLIESNPEEWKREIISTGTREAMTELESEILSLCYSRNDKRSFNQYSNGKFYRLGPVSEETRKKLSITSKNKKPNIITEEQKRKISQALKGRLTSEETCKKISEAKKGKPGKPQSDETKKKMSESRKGRIVSAETREKIRQANLGRVDDGRYKKASETKRKNFANKKLLKE
jgi:hypothetical protein